MKKKQNIVPLKDLNLTERFLFDEVMEDKETYQDVLGAIFGKEIPLLDQPQTEKELRVSPLIRSVRMDVFAMDEEESIYNTEMQNKRMADLAKRSRYYQSLIDTSLLEPEIPDYTCLNQSYVIMIMTFDLFGYGKYAYAQRAPLNSCLRLWRTPSVKVPYSGFTICLSARKRNAISGVP